MSIYTYTAAEWRAVNAARERLIELDGRDIMDAERMEADRALGKAWDAYHIKTNDYADRLSGAEKGDNRANI